MNRIPKMTQSKWLVGLAASLFLAACAPLPSAAPTNPSPAVSQTEVMPTDALAAFPVTLDHKFGSTEIKQAPKRIAVVGLTEQDALLALGITPVGTTEWFGKYPGAVWPWAQDKLGASVPELIGDAGVIKFETIAALKPDVILALYAGITQENYDLLSKIAPTVAQPKEYVDYGIPWQELTHKVGQIVGKVQEADALVAGVEAQFAKVRADHPEFEGATAVVATPYEGIWVYGADDVRGRMLTSLGFKLPDGLNEITGKEFGGNLSLERVDLLDVNAIIWLDASESKGPLGGPLYANLAVAKEGREVFLSSYNDPLGGATSFVSVLSLPYLLDGLVPMLAAAVDGDVKTVVAARPVATPPTTAATRLIKHAMGETQVPVKPQRVIALDAFFTLTPLIELGVPVIGSVSVGEPAVYPGLTAEESAKIESIGDGRLSNLEKVAALKPDLIIGVDFVEPPYDALSKIAPTVIIKTAFDWKDQFRAIGEATGTLELAETKIAEYDARVKAIRARMPNVTASYVTLGGETPAIYLMSDKGWAPIRILDEAGVQRPADEMVTGDSWYKPLSLELLPTLKGDVLLFPVAYPGSSEDSQAAQAKVLATPIWKAVPAVKNGRAFEVDGACWETFGGLRSAHCVLDDVERIFLK